MCIILNVITWIARKAVTVNKTVNWMRCDYEVSITRAVPA